MPSSSVPMDFAPLLSGGYRAARLTQLNVVRKTLRKEPQLHVVLEEEEPDDDEEEKHKQKPQVETQQHISLLHDLAQDEEEPPTQRPKTLQEMDEAMGRLALQLASKTPAYTRHLQDSSTKIVDDSDLQRYLSKQHPSSSSHCAFAPDYHEVNLGDWELKINWGGCANRTTNSSTSSKNKKNETTTTTTIGMDTDMHMHMHMHTETTTASSEVVTSSSSTTATGTTTTTSIISTKPIDAETLLQERRNPYLDQLSLSSRIGWSKADLSKIRKFPVLMELGVTGQSIASHLLPSQRPIPCIKSQEYQNRWAAKQQDGLRVQKGSSLRMDKEKTELDIQQRQALRSKMEKEKTKRILDAHSSLGFQTGKGRTITSSLMGPGGTERTGRPSRQVTNASHETEYIEQLDMVTNHTLFRDWAAVALRQYHRPKLPRHLVKPSLIWQCQIRYQQQTTKNKTATGGGGGGDNASSYQTMIMGTHAGAVSKAKLRSETDLSPTEGHLVLLEYCEERPPIPLTKGMASKIVTYYRGDKSRCPVSAGGGDRPTRRKRTGGTQNEQKKESSSKLELAKPPKLVGPNLPTNITDWIGKSPKKTKKENAAEDSIDILPEGVTEILHPKVHGPFMGEITNGESVCIEWNGINVLGSVFVCFNHSPCFST